MSHPYREGPPLTAPAPLPARGESRWFYVLLFVCVGACMLGHAIH